MIEVRELGAADRDWATEVETASWGAPVVARRGELVDLTALPGFVAVVDGRRVGLVTYAILGDECEVAALTSLEEGRGVGRALFDRVRAAAAKAGCRRLWLVTTNDNLRALELYQRYGLDLCAFRRHAVTEARQKLKPSIPERGRHGIPIAHELELELVLDRR